jgi:hypothetical protein
LDKLSHDVVAIAIGQAKEVLNVAPPALCNLAHIHGCKDSLGQDVNDGGKEAIEIAKRDKAPLKAGQKLVGLETQTGLFVEFPESGFDGLFTLFAMALGEAEAWCIMRTDRQDPPILVNNNHTCAIYVLYAVHGVLSCCCCS